MAPKLIWFLVICITYVAGEFPIGDLIIADGDAFTTGEPETITLGLTLGTGATTAAATAGAGAVAGAVAMGCGGSVAGSPAALFPVFTKDWCPFPFPFFCDLSPCASRMCTDSTDFVVKLAKQWEHLKPSAPSLDAKYLFFFSSRSLKTREKILLLS